MFHGKRRGEGGVSDYIETPSCAANASIERLKHPSARNGYYFQIV
jgi:hypothetical protein